jgi:hypothetical protein
MSVVFMPAARNIPRASQKVYLQAHVFNAAFTDCPKGFRIEENI